jgi:formylglycine-generating enzyme required for sulfatase activity
VNVKKRFFLAVASLLLAFSVRAGRNDPAGLPAIPGDVGSTIPAELVWITLFTDKIQKNLQGCWEVELGDGIEMVYVPAGDFLMGAPREEVGWEDGEGPVHRVFIKGILIGKYEVTRGQWRAVMGGGAAHPGERDLPQGDVSYNDIQKFLRALKMKSGFAFRLPTEAEWEKCCRGGSAGPDYGPINEISWNAQNSGDKIHPVGRKRPNNFGIFDMLGNVWEWCSDWYDASYYRESPYLNPTGPEKGKRRVQRGGGFRHSGHYLRCAHRNDQDPAKNKPYLGFRLVLDSGFK